MSWIDGVIGMDSHGSGLAESLHVIILVEFNHCSGPM